MSKKLFGIVDTAESNFLSIGFGDFPCPTARRTVLGASQRGRRLEIRPNTEARLAGWRTMTQPSEICLMMDASEGVLYRFAVIRAA